LFESTAATRSVLPFVNYNIVVTLARCPLVVAFQHMSEPPRQSRYFCSRHPLRGLLLIVASGLTFFGCSSNEEPPDQLLSSNVRCELVDWHPAGAFGLIRCPIAWIRITNYNNVPIKHVKIQFATYDIGGELLNKDVYEIEGEVAPGSVQNFTEQYLGLVNTHSEKLGVTLASVDRAM
jgi:hypothetical protein